MDRMTHLVAFAALFAAMAAIPAPEGAAKNNTGAVIGGIIAGAAVAAVISSEMKHPKTVYVPASPPPSPQSFSPKMGVICYPVQRACYNDRGAYSANWTWKIYAK